jgi:hypothetical protein
MAVITIPTPTPLVDFANSGFAPKDATSLIKVGSVVSLFSDLATKTIGIGIMPATGGGGGGTQGSISFN